MNIFTAVKYCCTLHGRVFVILWLNGWSLNNLNVLETVANKIEDKLYWNYYGNVNTFSMELNDQKILLTNQVNLRQSKILHIIILSHYIKMLYFKQGFLFKNICQEKFDQSKKNLSHQSGILTAS